MRSTIYPNHQRENIESFRFGNMATNRSVADSTVLTEAFECDYERNCTPLYKAIETAEDEDEYESILDFLETGKWTGPFDGIGGPSPMDQVKTWVTRFESEDETRVKWSQLPLHLAIVCGAPAQIVASLVKLYPEALRCTDDQHMLPLHLALRHESDDEVVAFLLIQFPESVNAKGKNGRTAVDCALRAKDKLRGIILEIFTEKTASKITAQMNKDKKELTNELDNRTSELLATSESLEYRTKELDNLLLEMDAADADRERNLEETVKKITYDQVTTEMQEKIEKLKSEKLLQEVIAQKRIDQLVAIIKEREETARQARAEEVSVKKELEAVHGRVAASASLSDLSTIKRESELLQSYRLEKTRSETKSTINSLKTELENSIQSSKMSDEKLKSELKQEMSQLKKVVDKIQQTETNAKTASELTELRHEVDVLRVELKERAAKKQTKLELVVMRKAMEMELRNAEDKTQEEMIALRKVVSAANTSDLEKKTAQELSAMKEEFENFKRDLNQKELATQTKRDVDDLNATLEKEMINADSTTKSELSEMKRSVEELQVTLANHQSTDEMVAVKQEVELMKEEFKKKDTSNKIKLEASLLKKMVESELKQSEGKTQQELLAMKSAIRELELKANDQRDVIELTKVRSELELVREELKEVEKISKTQLELEMLKKSLEQEIQNSKGKTEEELQALKASLMVMSSENAHSRELKQALENEIKNTNGKTEEELKQLKKSIDSIDLRKVESRNKTEWETIRKEMDVLTAFLKKRQVDGVGETQNELREVKAAVAAININKIESNQRCEFDMLRAEMDKLKMDMKKKQVQEEHLKQELHSIKATKEAKKKKGLKGFFRSVFAGYYNPGNSTPGNSKREMTGKLDTIQEKEEKPEESLQAIATIQPPRVAAAETETISVQQKEDSNDDRSWNSDAMKDAEKSKLTKVKELTLMQTRSRDQDVLSDDGKSIKSGASKSASKKSVDDDSEIESLTIVSLRETKSMNIFTNDQGSDRSASSLKKVNSDAGNKMTSRLHRPTIEVRDQPESPVSHPIIERAPRPKNSALKGSRIPLSLRKAKSMDPKMFSKRAAEVDEDDAASLETPTYSIVRTRSKPVISDNGEVELQRVGEDDEEYEDMIQPRVSFASHF